jgi:ubiquinone/menaquinone biosynthesis C-methylase UbiE
VIHQNRRATALAWIDELALPAGSRVLEIGCGAGLVAVDLARRGYRVTCVDTSDEMVALARDRAGSAGVSDSVIVQSGDAHALGFEDGAFDLVILLGVLPFLHSPQVALAEMCRVLVPGAALLVNSDNRYRLNHLLDPQFTPPLQPLVAAIRSGLAAAGVRRDERGIRAFRYSPATFNRMLTGASFVPTRSAMLGFGPFGLMGRRIVPESVGVPVNRYLQSLADRGWPVLRSTGSQQLVLARRS